MVETKQVSLREMVEAMAHEKDDAPFRWYQTSFTGSDGTDVVINAGPTLLVTMGQVRRELGLCRG